MGWGWLDVRAVVRDLYARSIQPKSQDEDSRRREFILNILLLGSLFLAAVATATLFLTDARLRGLGRVYRGVPPETVLAIFLIFLVLFLASRAQFYVASAYALIGIYLAAATYSAYRWGIDLPQGLLTYVLAIVMSGILLGTRVAIGLTVVIASTLIVFARLQSQQVLQPNLYWKRDTLRVDDAVVIVATLAIIAAVSWLSEREIEKSLQRARRSEEALRKERDLLEVKVEERSKELEKARLEKTLQLYRLAGLGRLAAGLFHDLVNPLTVVSLNLERLAQHKQETTKTSLAEVGSLIRRATAGMKHMEGFVQAVHRHMQQTARQEYFSLSDEVEKALQILSRHSEETGVAMRVECREPLYLNGDPAKFHQLMTNLIVNAIDAYADVAPSQTPRQVLIQLRGNGHQMFLTVQDWGSGISPEHLSNIFDPYFTTKSVGGGTGIGLYVCKNIVDKDFNGRIDVRSVKGEGTTFTVTLPLAERRVAAVQHRKEQSSALAARS